MNRKTAIKLYEDWTKARGIDPDIETQEAVIAAMEKYNDPWWEKSEASARIGELQLQEERLLVDFGLFHKSLEMFMGRPVWTHELAHPQELLAEKRDATPASMKEIIEKIPEEKRLTVVIPDKPCED